MNDIQELRIEIQAGFAKLDNRNIRTDALIDSMAAMLAGQDKMLAGHENRFDNIEHKITKLGLEFEQLRADIRETLTAHYDPGTTRVLNPLKSPKIPVLASTKV